jgi:Putative quorum-sensing-regulated virulence factor
MELIEKTLIFGKYEGKKLMEVPASYIKWLASHRAVLKSENRRFADAAKEMLEKKMYQVGTVVKIVRASIGAATVVASITKIEDGKIFARLVEGGIYEYSENLITPATDQDIVNAKAWHEREIEMAHPAPLNPILNIPEGWDRFDEDGVLIA